ncbi:MAG: SIR2 family protein, partial [Verrucomicrobiota bacterium]
GNRHRLNTAIIEEFTKRATLSPNHKLMAQLPIEVVWTTNYDTLIEKSYDNVDKRVDVKFSPGQLTLRLRNADVTVYKMHGDVSDPDHAVLTKDDYERYDVDREAFTEILRTDLTRNCFLFMGFSFTDPNIEYILSRLRRMLKGALRNHYCIMRRPQKPVGIKATDPEEIKRHDRALARFKHRVTDLKRFGIQTVAIDGFEEIEEMMQTLVRRAVTKNVFVSGSAHDFLPLGKDKLESLARRIGKELVLRGYNLVSGYGLGVGGACILGAHEAAYHDKNAKAGQRLLLRVFPQDVPKGPERDELYKRIRKEMAEQSGATIFLAGNKFDPISNTVVMADGMAREFEQAKERNHLLIPVPCTGHMAAKIWDEIKSDLPKYFGGDDVTSEFALLQDGSKTEDDWIEAIFSILGKMRK